MHSVSYILLLLLVFHPASALAAEIKNLRTGQDGKRTFLQYDLKGIPGEKEAEVTVRIEIAGTLYTANQLALSGDFGKNVKIGVGKRIYWDLLKDMPAGFDGEIGWDVEVIPSVDLQRLAREKAEQERLIKDKAEKERLAVVKIGEEKKQRELAEQQRLAALKVAEDKKQKEQAEKERLAREDAERRKTSAPSAGKPPLVANGLVVYDQTISDSKNKLMWIREADSTKISWSDIDSHLSKTNDNQFSGYSDWRLPTTKELSLLAEYAKAEGYGDKEGHYISDFATKTGFKNVKPELYWTANSRSYGNGIIATLFNFWSGYQEEKSIYSGSFHEFKQQLLLVRTVKVGEKPPSINETVKDKGVSANTENAVSVGLFKVMKTTVLDSSSSRMWAKLGDDAGIKMGFDKAQDYVKKMNEKGFAGHRDWRLPWKEDFIALNASVKQTAESSRIRLFDQFAGLFPGVQDWNYWIYGPSNNSTWTNKYSWSGARSYDVAGGTFGEHHKVDELCILPVRDVSESGSNINSQTVAPSAGVQNTAVLQTLGSFKVMKDVVFDSGSGRMWAKLGTDAKKMNYDKAVSLILKMNREKFGGFEGWRLPGDTDVSRLYKSIGIMTANSGDRTAMKVLQTIFPAMENWRYWQGIDDSRPLYKGANYSRSFDIEDGTATADLKDDSLYVLPVRDSADFLEGDQQTILNQARKP